MIAMQKELCNGCGTCVKVCPHRVLELENKKALLAAEDRCIECGACQLNCTESAILVTKGTGCLVAIVKEDILKISPKNTGCCGPVASPNLAAPQNPGRVGGGCC